MRKNFINMFRMRAVDRSSTAATAMATEAANRSDQTDRVSDASSIGIPADLYQNLAPVLAYVTEKPWIEFGNNLLERSLSEYVSRDPYALPGTSDREGYHGDRHYDYWLSGLKDYLCIKRDLAAWNVPLRCPFALLDFGCASGRVLRHFLCQESDLDLWSTDVNLRHVRWIRRYLAPSIRVFQNSALPYLPLEDNSLSLVYAFSVFTHIDTNELAWLSELRRVLKPGGIAYLTIHSERTWERLGPNLFVYNQLLSLRKQIAEYRVTEEFLKAPMPNDRTVFTWESPTATNRNVFHSTSYVRNVWGQLFEVLDVIDEGHNYQDVALLRKY